MQKKKTSPGFDPQCSKLRVHPAPGVHILVCIVLPTECHLASTVFNCLSRHVWNIYTICSEVSK